MPLSSQWINCSQSSGTGQNPLDSVAGHEQSGTGGAGTILKTEKEVTSWNNAQNKFSEKYQYFRLIKYTFRTL